MAETLRAEGIATWNIEYRRLPQPGSGWPGTFLDVGQAVDHLRSLAPQHNLDLNRVVVVGHSSGAHLGTWAAARPRLPRQSQLYAANPLPLRGVVSLAGAGYMEEYIGEPTRICRAPVVQQMLGGTPTEVPEHYAQGSPFNLLPLGVPQVVVWGQQDDPALLRLGEKYAAAAKRAGDPVQVSVIPGAGHFEPASPLAPTWPVVRQAIRSLLAGERLR